MSQVAFAGCSHSEKKGPDSRNWLLLMSPETLGPVLWAQLRKVRKCLVELGVWYLHFMGG
jgi:hypothetical protein